jgi:hypothetical protein
MEASLSVEIFPGSRQWTAWRGHYAAAGSTRNVEAMDLFSASNSSLLVRQEWPPFEVRDDTVAQQAGPQVQKTQTPLSPGARWLGLYGTAEEPLIDARGPLAKEGMRPSDKLIAVIIRDHQFREMRFPADEFLRKAPALRQGQHVGVEWQRDTEIKTAVAVTWGILLGNPEILREEDVVPFLQAHPLTRKRLLKWWTDKHPEAGPEVAEATLKNMNPRELQNATLLADNEAARPGGTRHQVHYQPDAELWRVR